MALEARIDQTKRDIDQYYTRLITTLQARKNEMLDGLNTLRSWLRGVREKMDKLQQAIDRARRNIAIPVRAVEETVNQFRTEIVRLNALIESQDVEFGWDKQREFDAANIGVLVSVNREDACDIMTLRMHHRFEVQAFGIKGGNESQLNFPEGVTVEPINDRTIIANYGSNSIEIFSMKGEFINRIRDNELQGPNGITSFNEEIYVTNMLTHCLTVHSFMTGEMKRKLGRKGKGDLEFSSPEGLSIVETSDGCLLYVADRDNNRVKVLNGDLSFVKHIGLGEVNQPRDVKVFNTDIYVLDGGMDACIKVFSKLGLIERQFLTQGIGRDVLMPRFFAIDSSGNLLISDKGNCSVLIYRANGEKTRLGRRGDGIGEFRRPTGITISLEGRIIVVDGSKDRNIVQLFDDQIIRHLLD